MAMGFFCLCVSPSAVKQVINTHYTVLYSFVLALSRQNLIKSLTERSAVVRLSAEVPDRPVVVHGMQDKIVILPSCFSSVFTGDMMFSSALFL